MENDRTEGYAGHSEYFVQGETRTHLYCKSNVNSYEFYHNNYLDIYYNPGFAVPLDYPGSGEILQLLDSQK